MPEIPQIQIYQTQAKIGIDSTPSKLEVHQQKADINMQTEHTKIQIDRTPIDLDIDSSRMWSALGKRSTEELNRVIAEESKRIALEGIARRASEAERLGDIHKGGNQIQQIAKENAFKPLDINFVGHASADSVDIRIEPGELIIDWIPGDVYYDVQPNKPQISYTPKEIDPYLRQKNTIEFSLSKVDRRI